jgi:hypothetical protein
MDLQGSYRDLSEVIFQKLPVGTETNHETSSWPPKHLAECTSEQLPLELNYSAKAAKKKRKQDSLKVRTTTGLQYLQNGKC